MPTRGLREINGHHRHCCRRPGTRDAANPHTKLLRTKIRRGKHSGGCTLHAQGSDFFSDATSSPSPDLLDLGEGNGHVRVDRFSPAVISVFVSTLMFVCTLRLTIVFAPMLRPMCIPIPHMQYYTSRVVKSQYMYISQS